jgi:hypothetical protein
MMNDERLMMNAKRLMMNAQLPTLIIKRLAFIINTLVLKYPNRRF